MKQLTFRIIILITFFGTTSFLNHDCSSTDITKLNDKKLQVDFFTRLDSVRKAQYPNNDQDTNNSVDLTPKLLQLFLKDINLETLKKNGRYDAFYFFNISPPQFKDSKECKDRISLRYFPESCMFRIEVENVYLVERDCIGGSQVSYGFKIVKDKIVDFGRNEAG
jgi:hypothetical protein